MTLIGFGLFWIRDAQGPDDDGPHKLTAPSTMSFAQYFRYGDESDADVTLGAEDMQEWEEIGVKNPTPIAASYSEEALNNLDTTDPEEAQEQLRSLKNNARFTVTGAYGKIADPEFALTDFLVRVQDNLTAASRKSGTHVVMQLGVPEETEADSLDGAVMQCATFDVNNLENVEGDSETTVCAWADYSTIALVTPYNGILDLSTEESAELTGNVRSEMRVAN
ncbi:hypothetical protein OG785_10165 [Streptomyces sp. NBC_00006]|uniref:hypothetical protein n=1 Tax=Streptomyces sp. NBC_00006 TaxID=2975619 RepID=UPI0022550CDA|nr:hypothetical protein [Streptomyces sp. NBC_00006]MCX5530923.1 hypothetical protein [Streptomyces sp. NBC_00006]